MAILNCSWIDSEGFTYETLKGLLLRTHLKAWLQKKCETNDCLSTDRLLQQVRAIDKLMLRRRDMLKMLMKPISDVDGNALRDSDDNDGDEVRPVAKVEPLVFTWTVEIVFKMSGRLSFNPPLKLAKKLPFSIWKHFFYEYKQSNLQWGRIRAFVSCHGRRKRSRLLQSPNSENCGFTTSDTILLSELFVALGGDSEVLLRTLIGTPK